MKYLQGAALAAGILGSATAFAQTSGNTASTPAAPAAQPSASSAAGTSRLSASDQDFVNDAAIGGLFEVESGKIAEKKAANAEVRNFAARMVRDHGDADNKLKRIVSADGGTVPNDLDQQHQQELQQLTSQQGADFDRNYMQTMVKDHDTDAQAFGRAVQSLDDPKLKTFAQQTLKVIDQHDKIAHQITDKMALK
jgi:putative membrane protein